MTNTFGRVDQGEARHPPCVSDEHQKIYGLGSLGLGGFFGGPLALAYLVYCDLKALGRLDLMRPAAFWFIPFVVFWLYGIFSFPPDLISQWMLYLPQTILWWIVCRHLLAKVHAGYRADGGLFKSRWRAIRFGVFTFLAIKFVFFVGAVASGG
jgi:hypothetical protein